MSYRVSTSDRDQKRIQEQNEKRLLTLVKQNGNSVCCDCGASGPRWASFNIGCFLCIRCGGIHRRMGTHISKVKSISLDKWTPEQLQSMEDWGNLKVNALYLHNAGTRHIPSDDDGIEQYIRDKYERKRFLRPGARVASDVENSQASSRDSPIMDTALRSLHDMGFTDMTKNRNALTRTNGNVPAAIELMCQEAELPQPTKVNSMDPRLTQLKAMGFEDMAANVAALRQSKGSVERAIELLVAQDTLPITTPPKASAVLGIPPQPVKNTSKTEDLFGDFTSAFTPESKNNQTKDAFGDFVFPFNETTTAPNTSNPTEAISNPTKGNKDYIMSLFGSAQPNSSAVPQFGAPAQQQFSNSGLNGLSFSNTNNAPTIPSFGAPVQQQFSNSGLNGIGSAGSNAPSNTSFGTPFTPNFSNPTSNQNPFQATPAANPVSQLDSAFASLDPFKLPGSNRAPPTSSNSFNSNANGSKFPPTSQTASATTQADLLDLL